mgnify:FL=1
MFVMATKATTKKSLKKIGIGWKDIPRVKEVKGAEDRGFPVKKKLPTEERLEEMINADNERKLKLDELARLHNAGEADTLTEFIRKTTFDGRELVLFHLEVLRDTTGVYKGCAVELKHKQYAAACLEDRGWGKAVANLNINTTNMNKSDELLLAEIRLLEDKIKGADFRIIKDGDKGGLAALPGPDSGVAKAGEDAADKLLPAVSVPVKIPQ